MPEKPNSYDLSMIKQYLELPMLLSIIESNIITTKNHFRIPQMFSLHLTTLQDRISMDLKNTKVAMSRHGIKVYEECREADRVTCKYLCRGYHGEMSLLWGKVQSDLEVKLANYMNLKTEELSRV